MARKKVEKKPGRRNVIRARIFQETVQTSADYPIDRGVPTPRTNHEVKKRYPWDEMRVGDSFFVPVADGEDYAAVHRRVSASASTRRHRHGGRYTIRRVEGGLRCWRLE